MKKSLKNRLILEILSLIRQNAPVSAASRAESVRFNKICRTMKINLQNSDAYTRIMKRF